MKAIKELALELIKATEVNDVARCLETIQAYSKNT